MSELSRTTDKLESKSHELDDAYSKIKNLEGILMKTDVQDFELPDDKESREK